MTFVLVYLACWAMMSLRLIWGTRIEPDEQLPLWGLWAVSLTIAVALGSVWPVLLLTRVGLVVWHRLGHPGA